MGREAMLLSAIEHILGRPAPLKISLCGAGGKTSALFDLAADFKARGIQVAVLTTTRMMMASPPAIDHYLSVPNLEEVSDLSPGITMLARGADENRKIFGFEPSAVDLWCKRPDLAATAVLVEADGANKKPLKAPREGEPRIPESTELVIGVFGADAFGQPAVKDWIHRVEIFLEITGLRPGEAVTSEAVAKLAVSEGGLFKACPEGVPRLLLINKAEPRHEAFIQALRLALDLPVLVVEKGTWP